MKFTTATAFAVLGLMSSAQAMANELENDFGIDSLDQDASLIEPTARRLGSHHGHNTGHCTNDDVICSPHASFYKKCVNGRFRFHRFDKCESCKVDKHGKRFVDDKCKYTVRIDNLSFQQPLGGIFVMTHNNDAEPLYEMGEEASEPLAILAETGNPAELVAAFEHEEGVDKAFAVQGPVLSGAYREFDVYLSAKNPYLTLGSMAINTNDCFVALNGVKIGNRGSVFNLPGLDAGSEANNELCTSIPGPACGPHSGNIRSGNGEGFVHIHRGFHGVNTGRTDLMPNELGANGKALSAPGYDWRNPMVRVTVTPSN
jgi:hypothetical protein